MTDNEVKKWLNRMHSIDKEIKKDKEEAKRIEDLIESLSGISYDTPKVQVSPQRRASFESRVERLEEVKERIQDRIVEKEEVREEITNTLNLLDDHYQRKVIILRHFNYYTWYKIERLMNYSEKQCRRIYQKAIENLVKIIENS